MARKTWSTLIVTLVLAAGLVASPALAKNPCAPIKNKTHGCKNEIKANAAICAAIQVPACSTRKGKDKRTCIRTCKTTWKTNITTACAANNTVCSASPSGAFVQ